MMNSDSIDRGEISAAHATGISTIGAVIVGGNIRVVKKEKKEENDNNNNNNNGISILNHRDIRDTNTQPKQQPKQEEKKEEEVVKKEENDGEAVPVLVTLERNKTKMTTLKNYNCYTDWKTGNWCWLSSDTIEESVTMTNINSQQQCCVKLEDNEDTNTITTTAVTSTVNGPTSTAAVAAITTATFIATNNSIAGKATAKTCRSSESDGPPKKKLKMNNIKMEDGIDDDSDNSKEYNGKNSNTDNMTAGVIKQELANNTSNDMAVGIIKQELTNNNRNHRHHKGDINIDQVVDIMIKEEETETDTEKVNSSKNSGNNNHNDDGYESWTEGSWCWLLPASSRGGDRACSEGAHCTTS